MNLRLVRWFCNGHRIVLGLFVLSVAFTAAAETLDFSRCVDTALQQNPGLQASQAGIEQAEAGLQQAQGARLPKVTVSFNRVRTNDALNAFGLKLSQRNATFGDFGAGQFNPANPDVLSVAPANLNYPAAINNLNSRIEAQLPLYTGGMIEGYTEQAQAYIQAARKGDESARQQVIFYVLQAYEGVHAARSYIEVARQGEIAAESYVHTIENLMKQGVVVRSDLLSARVVLDDIKVKLIQANNAEGDALDQLHMLLGLPLSQPLDIGAQVAVPPVSGNPSDLLDKALANNPGLQAMRHQTDAAEANVKVAKAGFYPQLGVMLRQDWNDRSVGFSASSYTIGAMLTWNVFDGSSTRGAVNRASAGKIELIARLRQAESMVALQVNQAIRKADEAEKRAAVREMAATQAEEALAMVEKRYNNGVTTITELLNARAQLDKARADVVAANYDVTVQHAGLLLALGKLEPDLK